MCVWFILSISLGIKRKENHRILCWQYNFEHDKCVGGGRGDVENDNHDNDDSSGGDDKNDNNDNDDSSGGDDENDNNDNDDSGGGGGADDDNGEDKQIGEERLNKRQVQLGR